MRALVLLTLVAVMCTAAFGLVAPTSQDQAKSLRDFWKNCSQIVRGRLGALANTDDITNPNGLIVRAVNGDVSVTYSPCASMTDLDGKNFYLYVSMPWNSSNPGDVESFTFTTPVTPDQVVQFAMPTQKGDVAHFTGQYYVDHPNPHVDVATVVTNCDESNSVTAYVENRMLMVTVTSINACARFPYTNVAMPPGAIAALIVVIVCFLLQLAACGYYHKTYSHDTPYTQQE